MASNNLGECYKNIGLVDDLGNLYEITVTNEDYNRIASEHGFALSCLNRAIELGVQPTKNIHSEDAAVVCDKDNETDCATNEVVASPQSRNEGNGSQYGANEIVTSPFNHDKNNSSKWTKNNTLLLIKSFESYKEEFDTCKRKKDVWMKISDELKKMGYSFDADDCDNKWRNLKVTYKKIKDKGNKTGRGKQSWEYFDLMDEALGSEHSINPVNLLYSSKSTPDLLNATEDEIHPSLRSGPLGGSSSSNSSSQSSSSTSLNLPTDHSTHKSVKERKFVDSDEAIVTPKSKKGKYRRSVGSAAPPDWFAKWNEDNKIAEEKAQEQTKNFQDEILKRLDSKNSILEKMADAFLKM